MNEEPWNSESTEPSPKQKEDAFEDAERQIIRAEKAYKAEMDQELIRKLAQYIAVFLLLVMFGWMLWSCVKTVHFGYSVVLASGQDLGKRFIAIVLLCLYYSSFIWYVVFFLTFFFPPDWKIFNTDNLQIAQGMKWIFRLYIMIILVVFKLNTYHESKIDFFPPHFLSSMLADFSQSTSSIMFVLLW